jgi:hypothetical protein
MDSDPSYGSELEVRNWLLYALMAIATIAVVAISLIGIATMTGIIPRSGTGPTKAQAVGTETWQRTRSNGSLDKSQERMPAAGKAATRSAAVCDNCAGIEP